MPIVQTAKPLLCTGCETPLDAGDLLWPIPDVSERVLPGEPMPAGECPNCGELVFSADDAADDADATA